MKKDPEILCRLYLILVESDHRVIMVSGLTIVVVLGVWYVGYHNTDFVPANLPGPMLLFERTSQIGRRFFACSAYRDRKLCPAYILESDWENERIKGQKMAKQSHLQLRSAELNQIRENILRRPDMNLKDTSFCNSCGEIFVDMGQHMNHKITTVVSGDLLDKPSQVKIV